MKRKGRLWAVMVVTAMAAAGCTTLQTPKVLEPGEVAIGIGGGGVLGDSDLISGTVFGRVGVAERLDSLWPFR